MNELKTQNTGYYFNNEYLWRIYEKGWLFYPMSATAYIWAKTRDKAEQQYRQGQTEEG